MRFSVLSKFGRAGPRASPGLVSRRRFFGASAGAAGAVLGSGLWTPARSDEHEKDDDEQQRRDCAERDPIDLACKPGIKPTRPSGIAMYGSFEQCATESRDIVILDVGIERDALHRPRCSLDSAIRRGMSSSVIPSSLARC